MYREMQIVDFDIQNNKTKRKTVHQTNKVGLTMGQATEKQSKLEAQLDSLINKAIAKIGAKKENDICRYLPVSTGGYMHHFTMRKLKHENPAQLSELISQYIIHAEKPKSVAPKQRAARGSRKRRDQITFTKQDLERMLHMARMAGDREMVRKLTPKRDLRSIKRELISSIRHGRIEPDLWNSYVEVITSQNAFANGFGNVAAPSA